MKKLFSKLVEALGTPVAYMVSSFAVVFFLLGLFGIIDGIMNVIRGGYADNILLGAMVIVMGPLACLGPVLLEIE